MFGTTPGDRMRWPGPGTRCEIAKRQPMSAAFRSPGAFAAARDLSWRSTKSLSAKSSCRQTVAWAPLPMSCGSSGRGEQARAAVR